MNNIRLYFMLLLCFPMFCLAQQELSLHTLTDVWQANRLNPALMPENGLTIGLPSIYNRFSIENIKLDELLAEDSGGTTSINLEVALPKLKQNNQVGNRFSLETLSFDFRLKNEVHLSLHHATQVDVSLNYPKQLAELIWLGNAAFIGETVSFAPQVEVLAYHEFGLGLAKGIGDFIDVGAKVKLLNGIGHIGTTAANNQLNLLTSDDVYQLQLEANYEINTSALLNYDNFGTLDIGFPSGGFQLSDLVSKNVGIAFDVGGIIRFERANVSLSILDIGGIRWRTKVKNYKLEGTYEYDGIDIIGDYLEGTSSFEYVTDSLRAAFAVE
ncbi:MAG: DUF5723 family protein [Bacteroidota bacterium]